MHDPNYCASHVSFIIIFNNIPYLSNDYMQIIPNISIYIKFNPHFLPYLFLTSSKLLCS